MNHRKRSAPIMELVCDQCGDSTDPEDDSSGDMLGSPGDPCLNCNRGVLHFASLDSSHDYFVTSSDRKLMRPGIIGICDLHKMAHCGYCDEDRLPGDHLNEEDEAHDGYFRVGDDFDESYGNPTVPKTPSIGVEDNFRGPDMRSHHDFESSKTTSSGIPADFERLSKMDGHEEDQCMDCGEPLHGHEPQPICDNCIREDKKYNGLGGRYTSDPRFKSAGREVKRSTSQDQLESEHLRHEHYPEEYGGRGGQEDCDWCTSNMSSPDHPDHNAPWYRDSRRKDGSKPNSDVYNDYYNKQSCQYCGDPLSFFQGRFMTQERGGHCPNTNNGGQHLPSGQQPKKKGHKMADTSIDYDITCPNCGSESISDSTDGATELHECRDCDFVWDTDDLDPDFLTGEENNFNLVPETERVSSRHLEGNDDLDNPDLNDPGCTDCGSRGCESCYGTGLRRAQESHHTRAKEDPGAGRMSHKTSGYQDDQDSDDAWCNKCGEPWPYYSPVHPKGNNSSCNGQPSSSKHQASKINDPLELKCTNCGDKSTEKGEYTYTGMLCPNCQQGILEFMITSSKLSAEFDTDSSMDEGDYDLNSAGYDDLSADATPDYSNTDQMYPALGPEGDMVNAPQSNQSQGESSQNNDLITNAFKRANHTARFWSFEAAEDDSQEDEDDNFLVDHNPGIVEPTIEINIGEDPMGEPTKVGSILGGDLSHWFKNTCKDCGGSGVAKDAKRLTDECPRCHGYGQEPESAREAGYHHYLGGEDLSRRDYTKEISDDKLSGPPCPNCSTPLFPLDDGKTLVCKGCQSAFKSAGYHNHTDTLMKHVNNNHGGIIPKIDHDEIIKESDEGMADAEPDNFPKQGFSKQVVLPKVTGRTHQALTSINDGMPNTAVEKDSLQPPVDNIPTGSTENVTNVVQKNVNGLDKNGDGLYPRSSRDPLKDNNKKRPQKQTSKDPTFW